MKSNSPVSTIITKVFSVYWHLRFRCFFVIGSYTFYSVESIVHELQRIECRVLSVKLLLALLRLQSFDNNNSILSRCLSTNNCRSPTPWKVTTISDQSFADGKWHRFWMRVTLGEEHSAIQCQVDGVLSTNIKINGTSTSDDDDMLFLGGLPGTSHIPQLNGNFTCFPELANFSGCIADLQIKLLSAPGHVRRLNTSQAKQYGDVSVRCTEAKNSIVSFADKNSKILLAIRDNIRVNTSYEFQIRTLQSQAFIGKITSQMVTALFFLEAGKMKVSARFKESNEQRGEFFHMSSNGISLSDNNWHKVSFHVAMETGANLLINDELKAQYSIREKLETSNLRDARGREAQVMLRFGRSARYYPSFIGCFRGVYVNKHLVNFSRHHSESKGIFVGKCANTFRDDWPGFEEDNNRNTSHLTSTADIPVKGKTVKGLAYKTTTTTPTASNTTGNIFLATTPKTKPHSSYDGVYFVAVALAVGLLVIVLATAYITRTCIKSRLQNCRKKPAAEENADTEFNNTGEISGKERESFQLAKCLRNTRIPGGDQRSSINFNQHGSIPNRMSNIYNADNNRYQSPVKVWEERYLSHAPVKVGNSNFLTVAATCYNDKHIHKTSTERSKENVSVDIDNIRSSIIPSQDESISVQKHGFHAEPSKSTGDCLGGGRKTTSNANLQSPKRLNKICSGHDSLPKPKKASGLSWAYGTRFIRHESSDTDCSDVDKVTSTRPRNQMIERGSRVAAVKPWQLKFLESSEDEQENHRRTASAYHLHGKRRRLQTFTEETYKLYSLKEEEREIELGLPRLFIANRPRVYFKDTYSIRAGNRSTSFNEAALPCEDTAGIGVQVRSLDGYTSSCPESIHCLSEKEDTGMNTRRPKRLTTYYF